MTWVESLAPVHNIFYAVLPIIFWIYVFIYTNKMACIEKQTSFIMGVLLFLIIFMTFDVIYCSILLNDSTFAADPAYDTIKPSISVSFVTSVLGVLASIWYLYKIRAGTYCGITNQLSTKRLRR